MLDSSNSSHSVLVRGKLNLVGEDHGVSDPRRALEQRFAQEMTGDSGYWVEGRFPDLHQYADQPGRRGRIQAQARAQQPEQGADLMELRGVHAAAMLLDATEPVVVAAMKVVALGGALPADEAAEYEAKIDKLCNGAVRLWKSWPGTTTSDVNTAVEDVFRNVATALRTYLDAPRTNPAELSAAALALADDFGDLPALVPALERAVGAPASGDPHALAEHMRTQRSSFMGMAAQFTRLTGVWKVGSLHVEDLLNGRANVRIDRANLVTMDAFNLEFDAWLSRQPQATAT